MRRASLLQLVPCEPPPSAIAMSTVRLSMRARAHPFGTPRTRGPTETPSARPEPRRVDLRAAGALCAMSKIQNTHSGATNMPNLFPPRAASAKPARYRSLLVPRLPQASRSIRGNWWSRPSSERTELLASQASSSYGRGLLTIAPTLSVEIVLNKRRETVACLSPHQVFGLLSAFL
ncbi:hypothetical protein FB451DRAFT_679014 [Mycena latifolia]|nr:hypothetical protein FB451DRAFT_679014 [Mycena latifolia]